MASEAGFSLYSQNIVLTFWLLIVLSFARLSFPFLFRLLASSSPGEKSEERQMQDQVGGDVE